MALSGRLRRPDPWTRFCQWRSVDDELPRGLRTESSPHPAAARPFTPADRRRHQDTGRPLEGARTERFSPLAHRHLRARLRPIVCRGDRRRPGRDCGRVLPLVYARRSPCRPHHPRAGGESSVTTSWLGRRWPAGRTIERPPPAPAASAAATAERVGIWVGRAIAVSERVARGDVFRDLLERLGRPPVPQTKRQREI